MLPSTVQGKVIKRNCQIEGINFVAVLDSGSDYNLVSEQVANMIKSRTKPVCRSALAVGGNIRLTKAIEFVMTIGVVTDSILAYVITRIPVDILLGAPFLMKHSQGFRLMMHEFPKARHPSEASVAVVGLITRKGGIIEDDGLKHTEVLKNVCVPAILVLVCGVLLVLFGDKLTFLVR